MRPVSPLPGPLPGGGICSLVVAGLLLAGAPPPSWPQDRYEGVADPDASGMGRPAEVYVDPSLRWSGRLPEARLEVVGLCRLRGEPASGPVWAGDQHLALTTLDPETGAHWLLTCPLSFGLPLWSVALPAPPSGAPAADAERVYVSLTSGEVSAHALADGSEIWKADLPEGESTGLAGVGGSLLAGSSAGLVALDPASGQVLFAAHLPSAPAMPPMQCGGRWVVSVRSGAVRALDPQDGSLLWERELEGIPSAPVCREDRQVVVGTSVRRVIALSAARGGKLWRQRLGGAVSVPPVVHDGGVYAGALDGRVYGLKGSTGHRLWTAAAGERVRRAPALVEGTLAVASAGETRLSLIHLPSGRVLLEAEAPAEAAGWIGSPVARADLLALAADRRDSPQGILIVYRVLLSQPS